MKPQLARNHLKASGLMAALILSLGLPLVLLVLAVGWPAAVQADLGDLLYVSATDSTCGGNAPCFANVQDAIDAALPHDTVLVSGGTYTDAGTADRGCLVALTKTVTLRGGYDASFTDPPNSQANPTTLDALRMGRVISITGDISPSVDGFVITGGDATGLLGSLAGVPHAGGGIWCEEAHPTIANNVISDNVASSADRGAGGGIYLEYCRAAVVSGNAIAHNLASTADTGLGGGICLLYSDATIHGNTIAKNTASTAHVGQGGGLYLYLTDAVITSNAVLGNAASTATSGGGGGFYIQYGAVTVSGNTVRDNVAGPRSLGSGGGLEIIYAGTQYGDRIILDGNTVVSNTAWMGGGVLVNVSSAFTLTNNVLAANRAGLGDGLLVSGTDACPSSGVLLHNTIVDNAGTGGEGLRVAAHSIMTLTNNIVAGHQMGIHNDAPSSSLVSAHHTLFHDNATANYGDGVSSTDEVRGGPRFVNPLGFDYHLLHDSAAINRGTEAGVTADIDGDPRPIGHSPDIGADEFDPDAPTPTLTYTPTNTLTPTPTRTAVSTQTRTPTVTLTPVDAYTPTPSTTAQPTTLWKLYLPVVLKAL